MRKFFPRARFTTGTPPSTAALPWVDTGGFYDFNGNGVPDEAPIYLEGHESLVFFLGGIPIHTRNSPTGPFTLEGLGGFGANPRNPFVPEYNPTTGGEITIGQNRSAPFFEFRAERLVDDDLDGIPGYIDPLGQGPAGRYFAYFSSYAGQGYDPNDVNFNSVAIDETGRDSIPFSVSFPVIGGGRETVSPLPNPYTSSLPVAAGQRPATFHQPQSFQIISAGRDRLFGVGGQYTDSSEERLPPLPLPPPVPSDDRRRERDNVTNFANGTLD